MNTKNGFIISLLSSVCVLALFLGLSVSSSAAETVAHSWYVMRTKDHTQPHLEGAMSFIEKYDGYYVDKSHVGSDGNDKVVYLTFDAGYENGNVARILNTLKEKNVTGAFFILENLIIRSPELVKRMADEGHTVCNHTAKHHDMTKVCDIDAFAAELDSLSDQYYALTGEAMAKYYRPPEGRFSEQNLEFCKALGYKTIFWSFAYADWDNDKQPSADEAMELILANVHNGAVLLLHPTSKTNADILGDVIDALRSDGYRFGTLDELTGEG